MTSANVDLELKHEPGHIKHDGHNLIGFVIFLCSESIAFATSHNCLTHL